VCQSFLPSFTATAANNSYIGFFSSGGASSRPTYHPSVYPHFLHLFSKVESVCLSRNPYQADCLYRLMNELLPAYIVIDALFFYNHAPSFLNAEVIIFSFFQSFSCLKLIPFLLHWLCRLP
jgi:hypothetical protein